MPWFCQNNGVNDESLHFFSYIAFLSDLYVKWWLFYCLFRFCWEWRFILQHPVWFVPWIELGSEDESSYRLSHVFAKTEIENWQFLFQMKNLLKILFFFCYWYHYFSKTLAAWKLDTKWQFPSKIRQKKNMAILTTKIILETLGIQTSLSFDKR